MITQKNNMIPVIIQSWIDNVRDPKIPDHIKFNYVQNMREVVAQLSEEIRKYDQKQVFKK